MSRQYQRSEALFTHIRGASEAGRGCSGCTTPIVHEVPPGRQGSANRAGCQEAVPRSPSRSPGLKSVRSRLADPRFDHLCGHAMRGTPVINDAPRVCSVLLYYAHSTPSAGKPSCSWRFPLGCCYLAPLAVDKMAWSNAGRARMATATATYLSTLGLLRSRKQEQVAEVVGPLLMRVEVGRWCDLEAGPSRFGYDPSVTAFSDDWMSWACPHFILGRPLYPRAVLWRSYLMEYGGRNSATAAAPICNSHRSVLHLHHPARKPQCPRHDAFQPRLAVRPPLLSSLQAARK
jgi:hypothetical protein